jgi:hypothetical protein
MKLHVFPADKTFGKEFSNGSWDGMIGDILEQVQM